MSDGLQVHDVVVRYGTGPDAVTAVDRVDLDVPAGEVVALLGPSGCGKSSLLRAVAGLEPVAAGDVAWDGVSVARTPVHRRGFGLMFQDGQLFGHLDVGANVAYGLPRGRGARPARDARVEELLDLVGLPGVQRRDVATLSGGQRQRVALARALAPRPRLLLLDEPLSALDRTLRERLALDLRDVLVATGTTALLVTHDQDEAFAVADRIAVMDAGRLLQVAAPAALWARPADRRTAQLLGYEVFLGTLDTDASAVRALAAHVPHPGVVALAAGAFVVVPDQDATAGPAGDVHVQRSRRGRTEVVVDVAGVGRVTALAPSAWSAAPGTRVALRVDPAGVAVLPAGS